MFLSFRSSCRLEITCQLFDELANSLNIDNQRSPVLAKFRFIIGLRLIADRPKIVSDRP